MAGVKRYCRILSEKHVSCFQDYLRRKVVCIHSHRKEITDLCCNNGLFFAPTRSLASIIS